jgi:uncharacterized membrane protein YfcA
MRQSELQGYILKSGMDRWTAGNICLILYYNSIPSGKVISLLIFFAYRMVLKKREKHEEPLFITGEGFCFIFYFFFFLQMSAQNENRN